tara:strand:+ start:100 stop:696 length:597 start_codon:yes stop_codon:yes gene_type:complete
MLYSYQAQEPQSLPNRVRLSDGSTRTSLDQLTPSDLLSLGFTGPYTQPSYNSSTEKVIWSSDDLQYQIVALSQQELDALTAQELQNRINSISYLGFWNALIQSPIYNKLRLAAAQDLSANTFCTELIALFSDAKNGNPNTQVIQHYLNILFFVFDFTPQERTEIETLMNASNMSALYTLPSEEYISSHTYDPITNTIS